MSTIMMKGNASVSKSTLIRVHLDTLNKLSRLGNAGQSYNSVLETLLEHWRKCNFEK